MRPPKVGEFLARCYQEKCVIYLTQASSDARYSSYTFIVAHDDRDDVFA